MDNTKLRELINNKNERLEDRALQTASSLIDQIASEQQKIADANARIVELRKELITLEIQKIEESAILG